MHFKAVAHEAILWFDKYEEEGVGVLLDDFKDLLDDDSTVRDLAFLYSGQYLACYELGRTLGTDPSIKSVGMSFQGHCQPLIATFRPGWFPVGFMELHCESSW